MTNSPTPSEGKSDPERIWLQNAEDARAIGDRLWCADKVWPECPEQQEPTEYVRADLFSRLERELAEARAKLFPYADATEISGISFDGKYLIGDKKSISYFHEMKNRGEQIDVYKQAYDQRIAAAEAKIDEARRKAFNEVGRKAREYAAHYPEASDGRNTFIIFAEWAEEKAEGNR